MKQSRLFAVVIAIRIMTIVTLFVILLLCEDFYYIFHSQVPLEAILCDYIFRYFCDDSPLPAIHDDDDDDQNKRKKNSLLDTKRHNSYKMS